MQSGAPRQRYAMVIVDARPRDVTGNQAPKCKYAKLLKCPKKSLTIKNSAN